MSSPNGVRAAARTAAHATLLNVRQLHDLAGIGPAMLRDLHLLNIHSVPQLARQDPVNLYNRLIRLTATRQDICVLDVFRCAVAQARDPHLPIEQRNWWYWSRQRKVSPA